MLGVGPAAIRKRRDHEQDRDASPGEGLLSGSRRGRPAALRARPAGEWTTLEGRRRPARGSCRCIVPDWPMGSHRTALNPGADLSPPGIAGLIAAFMDALELDRVTLVGNDTGGAMSQIFTAAHPDRVERLILTNCDTLEHFPPFPF